MCVSVDILASIVYAIHLFSWTDNISSFFFPVECFHIFEHSCRRICHHFKQVGTFRFVSISEFCNRNVQYSRIEVECYKVMVLELIDTCGSCQAQQTLFLETLAP